MKNFKEYLEEQEIDKIQLELNEDLVTTAGSIFGYAAAGLLVGWGGSLVIKSYVSFMQRAVAAITKHWRKFVGKPQKKNETTEVIQEIKKDQVVKVAIEKSKLEREEHFKELESVFLAIEGKDVLKAEEELKNSKVKITPVITRVLITEITKVLGEPPIHYGNTGNECYLFVKGLLGIKVAQSAAMVVKEALKKHSDELIQDLDKENKPVESEEEVNDNQPR